MTKKMWRPVVAGIINVVVGAGVLIFAFALIVDGVVNPRAGVDIEDFGNLVGFILLPFSILTLIGGICALQRKHWMIAMLFPLALVPTTLPSIIMVSLSQQEFRVTTQTAETGVIDGHDPHSK